jgi:hypothetical protein
MYSYYFVTSMWPEYKNNVWWKKHITQLQMVCKHKSPLIQNISFNIDAYYCCYDVKYVWNVNCYIGIFSVKTFSESEYLLCYF